MNSAPILYSKNDKIGRITFNRPDNRNSMTNETVFAFQEIVDQVRRDKELRCLVVTGSGNTFCGGADFNSGFDKENGSSLNETLMDFYRPFLAMGSLEIPVIAAINGHAIGGGFGITLMSDIRVADRQAKLGANFARLGLHSGMAISYVLPRLVGLAKANELLFTGRIITGEQAASMGLVNYAVEGDAVMEKAMALAAEIASSAPAAIRMMKRSIYRGLDWNPLEAAEVESFIQARTFEMEDGKEGIKALLEKRSPEFKGK